MSLYIPSLSEIMAVSHSRGADSNAPHLWNGLAGLWPMQEGGGATAFDVSGFGNHGTLTNMDPATDWVVGEKGHALDFASASSQYIALADTAILRPASSLSLSMWAFRRTATTGGLFQSAGYDASNGGYKVSLSSGKISFSIRRDASTWKSAASDSALPDVTWTHVACTWDGATMSVYIDGKVQSSPTACDAIHYGVVATTPHFGLYSTYYFNGQLTNGLCYNRALTPSEIEQLYAEPWAMPTMRRRVYPAVVAGTSYAMPMAIQHYKMAGAL